jgi:hypothetical protein
MRLETLDLSKYTEESEIGSHYSRMSRTYIKLLSSQVPESFLERFEDEETALKELLDVVYGTMELSDEDL